VEALPAIRSRAATVLASAGALSLLLGAAALIAPPGASASQPEAAPITKADPKGNNGTIKIEGTPIQSGPPDNNPHQGCTFVVEFYNFDKGAYNATVHFEDQAPTADGGLKVVSGDLHPFIGGDAAGGGRDLDARVTYTLSFTGAPQPKQGYHVKITVEAPGSIGADTKHKVFWVDCRRPPTTVPTVTTTVPESVPTSVPTEVTTTVPESVPTSVPTDVTTTVPDTAPTSVPTDVTSTVPDTAPTSLPTEVPTEVPPGDPALMSTTAPTTAPTTGGTSSNSTVATASAVAAAVPTAVNAGIGGGDPSGGASAGSGSSGILGGGLLAAGGLLLALGGFLGLRRRGQHSL
jgi:hypothetical protein